MTTSTTFWTVAESFWFYKTRRLRPHLFQRSCFSSFAARVTSAALHENSIYFVIVSKLALHTTRVARFQFSRYGDDSMLLLYILLFVEFHVIRRNAETESNAVKQRVCNQYSKFVYVLVLVFAVASLTCTLAQMAAMQMVIHCLPSKVSFEWGEKCSLGECLKLIFNYGFR